MQRILKEHGIKSVQAVADQNAAISFGAVEEAIGQSLREPDEEEAAGHDTDAEEEEYDDGNAIEIDYRFVDPDEDGILAPFKGRQAPSAQPPAAAPAPARGIPAADRERLQRALQDLIGCREMLDSALRDG